MSWYSMRKAWRNATGIEDGDKNTSQGTGAASRSWNRQVFPECLEGTSPGSTFVLDQWDPCQIPNLQKHKVISLFCSIKFMVIFCSSNKKKKKYKVSSSDWAVGRIWLEALNLKYVRRSPVCFLLDRKGIQSFQTPEPLRKGGPN